MEQDFNYFLEQMQEYYTQLTGIPVQDASDVGIRFRVLAQQLAGLQQELKQAQIQAFPQTATGENLELHAAQRGIVRKQAVKAKGEVVFSRTTAASEDMEIPAEIALTCASVEGSAEVPPRYVTTKAVILHQGETQVTAPVECQSAGAGGNIAAQVLNVMITPVQGIVSVTNPSPISSGEDAESDEALRQRLLDSYQAVTNGTNTAFYYNKAMSYSGVSSAKVLPRVNGVGTVGIVVSGAGVDDDLIAQMKQEIGEVKEINVDLSVEKATQRQIEISAQIAVEDGYSYEDVSQNCQQAVEKLMEQQKIGQPVYQALIVRELLSCEGVANCKVVSPSEDTYPLEKEIFTLSQCTISQMDHQ